MAQNEPETPSAWLGGLPYRLWRANQALHRRVVEAIDELGLTVTQLGILVHLDELGHMSASDLARLFRLTPQSTTTALNRLEAAGWVQRVPHPIHRRVIWYEVTPSGLEVANDGRKRVAAVNREVESALGDIDRSALSTALSIISATFDEDIPAGTMWPVR